MKYKDLFEQNNNGEKYPYFSNTDIKNLDYDEFRKSASKEFKKDTEALAADRERDERKSEFIEKNKIDAFNKLTDNQKWDIVHRMGIGDPNLLSVDFLFSDKKNIPQEILDMEEYKMIQEVGKHDEFFNKGHITKLINDCARTSNIPIYEPQLMKSGDTYTIQKGEFIPENFGKLLEMCISNKIKTYVTDRFKLGMRNLGARMIRNIPVVNVLTHFYPSLKTDLKPFLTKLEQFPYPPLVVTLPYRNENGTYEKRQYLAPPGVMKRAAVDSKGQIIRIDGNPVWAYKKDRNGNPITQSANFSNMEFNSPEHANLSFFVPDENGKLIRDEEQEEITIKEIERRINLELNKDKTKDIAEGKKLEFRKNGIRLIRLNISPGGTKENEISQFSRIKTDILIKNDGGGNINTFLSILNPDTYEPIASIRFINNETYISENVQYKVEIDNINEIFNYYPRLLEFDTIKQSEYKKFLNSEMFRFYINNINIINTLTNSQSRRELEDKISANHYKIGDNDFLNDLMRTYFEFVKINDNIKIKYDDLSDLIIKTSKEYFEIYCEILKEQGANINIENEYDTFLNIILSVKVLNTRFYILNNIFYPFLSTSLNKKNVDNSIQYIFETISKNINDKLSVLIYNPKLIDVMLQEQENNFDDEDEIDPNLIRYENTLKQLFVELEEKDKLNFLIKNSNLRIRFFASLYADALRISYTKSTVKN